MDDSTQRNPSSEDSVSMYLSFADDTMMSTNTVYNTIESVKDFSLTDVMAEANKTLEAEDNKLGDTKVSRATKVEQLSPLRPFDKNVFNKFNAMSSTPSKDIMITAKPLAPVYENSEDLNSQSTMDNIDVNKENTHPDLGGDASSLSSTVDGTTSKTLVMSTTDDESVQEFNKSEAQQKKTNKDVSSVRQALPKLSLPSRKSTSILKKSDDDDNESKEEDIKYLIDKMLKLTEKVERKKSSGALNSVPSYAAKSRSSLLPTAVGDKRSLGFKQRMSVVVKTTLNSPARKMANKIGPQRRSVLPVKSGAVGYSNSRQSLLPTAKPTSSGTMRKSLHPSATQVGVKINAPVVTAPSSKYKFNVSSSYSCVNCGASFRIKSLLDAHKRSHEEDGSAPNFVKKTLGSSVNASATSTHLMSANQCKYCDKKFAIERALHIHLMQNCNKIPPGDKRKLEFTELNYEKKAQLPVFPHGGTDSPHMTPVVASTSMPVVKAGPQASSESFKSKMMPPSSVKKPRQKSTPHAGVYRTPTKTVPCHICKQSFKSILDYTNHSLTMHSTNAKNKQIQNEAQSANHLTKK